MNGLTGWFPLLGRILIGHIFLLSGLNKIFHYSQTAAYMASKNVPMIEALLVLSIIVEIAGALMIIFGWRAKLAAAVFFLWLIPVTFMMHNFWAVPAAEKMGQLINFQKNLVIMGTMLYIVAFGPGRYSLRRD
ncbi:MAG: DoxX family protein [Sulfurifustaceae bacterium]